MKVAIAKDSSVSCPDCAAAFEVDASLYGAEVECPSCSCQFRIQAPATGGSTDRRTTSGIQIENPDEAEFAPMATVRLTRDKAVMNRLKQDMPKSTADKKVDTMPEVEPKHDIVACPSCAAKFEIVPEFYGAVGECPDCNAEFLIKRPGTQENERESFRSIRVRSTEGTDKFVRGSSKAESKPEPSAPAAAPPAEPAMTTSGIEIERDELAPKQYAATATVRLSRNMSMAQQKRQELAPPPPPERVATMPEVAAVGDAVTCPGCSQAFEISTEFYGAVAECPDCDKEFVIRPPAPEPRAKSQTTGSTGSSRRPSATPKSIGTEANQKAQPTPQKPAAAKQEAAPEQKPAGKKKKKGKPAIGRKSRPAEAASEAVVEEEAEAVESSGNSPMVTILFWVFVGLIVIGIAVTLAWWLSNR